MRSDWGISIRLVVSVTMGVLVALLVSIVVAVALIPWLQIYGPITYIIPLLCAFDKEEVRGQQLTCDRIGKT